VKTDGTNAQLSNDYTFEVQVVASLKIRGTDTAQRWAFHIPKLPPCKFFLRFGNFSSTNMLDTTSLTTMLYTTELASA
jgi:hypothetical protein